MLKREVLYGIPPRVRKKGPVLHGASALPSKLLDFLRKAYAVEIKADTRESGERIRRGNSTILQVHREKSLLHNPAAK